MCAPPVGISTRRRGVLTIDRDKNFEMSSAVTVWSKTISKCAPLLADIYSASWGPDDDGRTVDGPGPLTRRALGQLNYRSGQRQLYTNLKETVALNFLLFHPTENNEIRMSIFLNCCQKYCIGVRRVFLYLRNKKDKYFVSEILFISFC